MATGAWRETLARNWLYVLTSVLLSLLLWVVVSADAVTQQVIPADLVIVNGDRRYVMTGKNPETETVDVLFTGRIADLVALSVARPRIVLTIDSVHSEQEVVELDPDMVRGRGARELTDVRALSVHPERVRLQFEPRAQKVVRVVPRARVSVAEGFALADSVRVEPGAVAVEGPQTVVRRIDSLTTVPISRDQLREPLRVEVPVEVPAAARRLVELSSPTVDLLVAVEPRIERVVSDIPVTVIAVGVRGDLRVQPPKVSVRLSGPRSVLASVRRETLSPSVEIHGPPDLGTLVAVEIEPPQPFVQATVEPDSVRVVRR